MSTTQNSWVAGNNNEKGPCVKNIMPTTVPFTPHHKHAWAIIIPFCLVPIMLLLPSTSLHFICPMYDSLSSSASYTPFMHHY